MIDVHQPNHSARTRFLGVLLAILTILAVPLAIAYSGQTTNAAARVAAVGNATVIWGNPFLVPTMGHGRGWERIAVQGTVFPTSDANGFYTFQTIRLTGRLHTEWTNVSDSSRYVLDATFATRDDYTENPHYYPLKIIPAVNALEATGLEFTGILATNGKSRPLYGLVAVTTAVPGQMGFQGSYPVIYAVFYVSSEMLITISWSQASQTIRGVYYPACSGLVHLVRLASETGW